MMGFSLHTLFQDVNILWKGRRKQKKKKSTSRLLWIGVSEKV